MRELITLSAQIAAGIALPAVIVKLDERRLDVQALNRCWPPASFWCSVVTFGLFCLPVHFCRTRRSLLGFVQGMLWALSVAVALGVLGWMSGPTSD